MRAAATLLLLVTVASACTLIRQSDAELDVGTSANLRRFEYTQVHMGVQARLLLYAPDSTAARRAAAAAFDRIAELDQTMSDYRVDSELMELVRRAGDGRVAVSDDLLKVLSIAQRISRQSEGAFDVTIGPLVRLWREARRRGKLPPSDEIDLAMRRVGADRLRLYEEGQAVELLTPEMLLDLGGIAKGYAADEAIETLRRHGVTRALVEFGGDIVVSDPPPEKRGWQISVPLESAETTELILSNAAVSTSGDTQQFVEIDGTRYSHVVDPRTGIGLTSRIAVTVVAPTGVLSDALATALSVMGRDEGQNLVDTQYPDVEVYFRYVDS